MKFFKLILLPYAMLLSLGVNAAAINEQTPESLAEQIINARYEIERYERLENEALEFCAAYSYSPKIAALNDELKNLLPKLDNIAPQILNQKIVEHEALIEQAKTSRNVAEEQQRPSYLPNPKDIQISDWTKYIKEWKEAIKREQLR